MIIRRTDGVILPPVFFVLVILKDDEGSSSWLGEGRCSSCRIRENELNSFSSCPSSICWAGQLRNMFVRCRWCNNRLNSSPDEAVPCLGEAGSASISEPGQAKVLGNGAAGTVGAWNMSMMTSGGDKTRRVPAWPHWVEARWIWKWAWLMGCGRGLLRASRVLTVGEGSTRDGVAWTTLSEVLGVTWDRLPVPPWDTETHTHSWKTSAILCYHGSLITQGTYCWVCIQVQGDIPRLWRQRWMERRD